MRSASLLPSTEAVHCLSPTPLPSGARPAGEWPIALLGIPFSPLTVDRAVERIAIMQKARRPHFVFVANTTCALQAQHDAELKRILANADLVLCESVPLTLAARCARQAVPHRISGRALQQHLLLEAAAHQRRVFLLGGKCLPDALANPFGVHLVGWAPATEIASSGRIDLRDRVRATQADLLLARVHDVVAVKWLAAHHDELGARICLCTLDSSAAASSSLTPAPSELSGSFARAWDRAVDRLRDCRDAVRNGIAAVGAVRRHTPRPVHHGFAAKLPRVVRKTADGLHVDVGTELTRGTLDRHAAFWAMLLESAGHCLLDLSSTEQIDAAGIGFLLGCRTARREANRELVLLTPSEPVRRAFAAMQIETLFRTATNATEAYRSVSPQPAEARVQPGLVRSLAWCGEITGENAEDVWQLTSDYMRTFASNGATLVMINLARLRRVDEAGASLMLRLKKSARELQVELLFAQPQANVCTTLRLARIEHLLLEGAQ